MGDIVDSMEEFEAAKEAGRGAIAMTQSTTLVVDGVKVEIGTDRMWDEATNQAAGTPIDPFRNVYENRPDQHDKLEETYGTEVVERTIGLENCCCGPQPRGKSRRSVVPRSDGAEPDPPTNT